MILRIDNTNKEGSLYECDKCKRTTNNPYRIVFDKKTYHLCKKHYLTIKQYLNKKVDEK